MQRAIAVVSVLLSCFAVAAAQSSPEILVERHLLRADRLMESGDPKGALELMKKIMLLQMAFGVTLPDGKVEEGSYADWKRQGRWVIRNANGDVEEGPYVNGKKHGQWIIRKANGEVEHMTFENDESLGKPSRSRN